jgi:hypothetical protein
VTLEALAHALGLTLAEFLEDIGDDHSLTVSPAQAVCGEVVSV